MTEEYNGDPLGGTTPLRFIVDGRLYYRPASDSIGYIDIDTKLKASETLYKAPDQRSIIDFIVARNGVLMLQGLCSIGPCDLVFYDFDANKGNVLVKDLQKKIKPQKGELYSIHDISEVNEDVKLTAHCGEAFHDCLREYTLDYRHGKVKLDSSIDNSYADDGPIDTSVSSTTPLIIPQYKTTVDHYSCGFTGVYVNNIDTDGLNVSWVNGHFVPGVGTDYFGCSVT